MLVVPAAVPLRQQLAEEQKQEADEAAQAA
jgi:hypothetical protein